MELITSSKLGSAFGTNARTINRILSELGWIEKQGKNWILTQQGESRLGQQKRDFRSKNAYVVWPEGILTNNLLKHAISQTLGKEPTEQPKVKSSDDFREKFKANLRAMDGHFVRSKAEMLIDNWLYMAGIVHAYERKLPIEEEAYCDFYQPQGKVYIEYWGLEETKYQQRKAEKQAIYTKYNFSLIELTERKVKNLDDILPGLLLKFGIQTY